MKPTKSFIPRRCKKCNKTIYRWTDSNNFNICDCDGELQSISLRKADQVVYNRVLGCHPSQIPEMMKIHPNSEYSKDGCLVTQSFYQQVKEAHRRGMDVK